MTGTWAGRALDAKYAGLTLAGLLTLAFVTRSLAWDQPIVENYVGRQVPTAMVARNLERDGSFLTPHLDVAPFPNLFLVEPPLYAAAAVGLRRLTGLSLGGAGRVVSALGIVLAAWGLYGLTARRGGNASALAAVAVFITLPVTVRYGRSFQPDALMLGCVVAGLDCWDRFAGNGRVLALAAGVALLATGFSLKVTSAYVLVPLVAVVIPVRRPGVLALAAATLLPALLWYTYAAGVLASAEGSSASADNGVIWLRVLIPDALLRRETYLHVRRFLGVRAFTPLGPPLALLGFVFRAEPGCRLWRVWAGSAAVVLLALAAKLHHEYYWLALAPPVAVGVSRFILRVSSAGRRGVLTALVVSIVFLGLSAGIVAPTWKTPPEWAGLREAGVAVRSTVPAGALVVAPEALLFEADRRGCRLELTPAAARRAAGEWRAPWRGGGAAGLVEFYRARGATYFADVRPADAGAARLDLHDQVRRRYKVLVDRPGILIALLTEPREDSPHVNGTGRTADAPDGQPARRDDP